MSRQARQYSKTGLYHIIFRGMSRHDIFEEEENFIKIKDIRYLQDALYKVLRMKSNLRSMLFA